MIESESKRQMKAQLKFEFIGWRFFLSHKISKIKKQRQKFEKRTFKNVLKTKPNPNLSPNLSRINLIQIAQLITYTTLTYKLVLIHLILMKKYYKKIFLVKN